MAEIKRDLKGLLKILQEGIKTNFAYSEMAIDEAEKIEEDFIQISVLLVYLYLDLKVEPYIKNKYISEMKDGYAKDTAQNAFKIAKEIGEGSLLP